MQTAQNNSLFVTCKMESSNFYWFYHFVFLLHSVHFPRIVLLSTDCFLQGQYNFFCVSKKKSQKQNIKQKYLRSFVKDHNAYSCYKC